MKKLVIPGLVLAASLVAAPLAFAQTDELTTSGALTAAIDVSVCGQATITYTSANSLPYSGDYRVGDEAGTADEFSDLTVAEGPLADTLFGDRYHPVAIAAGATVTQVVDLDEDQGGGTVAVSAWVNRGPEQNAYAAVVTAQVDTDCQDPAADDTTTATSSTATTTSATAPSVTTAPPTVDPKAPGFSQIGTVPAAVDTGRT